MISASSDTRTFLCFRFEMFLSVFLFLFVCKVIIYFKLDHEASFQGGRSVGKRTTVAKPQHDVGGK